MKTKLIKSLALIIISILTVCTFSSCITLGMLIDKELNNPNDSFVLVTEPTLSYTYSEELQGYEVVVEGIAKNNGERTWDWVDITLMLYDADHNALGSASDSIESIGGQSTWRYRATAVTSYEPTSVELFQFSGYTNDIF
jgi:hypothetical protein